MAVDMILLGFVKDIHDYELVISLPNGQLGVVGITNISTTYTKCLQKMVDSGGLAPDLQVRLPYTHSQCLVSDNKLKSSS